jgi:uncharacterized protein (TIGR02284 family)
MEPVASFVFDNQGKLTRVFNDLVRLHNDRISAYQQAGEQMGDQDLNGFFSHQTQQSQQLRSELEREILQLGAKVTADTTPAQKFQRLWKGIQGALSGQDQKTILQQCQHSEEAVVEAYESALEAATEGQVQMPPAVFSLVEQQSQQLRQSVEQVRRLKESIAS